MSRIPRTALLHTLGTVLLWLAAQGAAAETVLGLLEYADTVPLGTSATGRVERILVHPGQRVRKGQLLAELDPRALEAALEQARAELHRLELAHQEAGREYERNRELYERASISAHDLKLAEIAHAQSAAELAAARARVQRARVELEYSRIHAPFDGIVSRVLAAPGQMVVNRCRLQPLLELAPAGRLQIRLNLDPAGLQALQQAEALLVDGVRVTARPRSVSPAPAGGIHRVVVALEGAPAHWSPPRLVRLQIPQPQPAPGDAPPAPTAGHGAAPGPEPPGLSE